MSLRVLICRKGIYDDNPVNLYIASGPRMASIWTSPLQISGFFSGVFDRKLSWTSWQDLFYSTVALAESDNWYVLDAQRVLTAC